MMRADQPEVNLNTRSTQHQGSLWSSLVGPGMTAVRLRVRHGAGITVSSAWSRHADLLQCVCLNIPLLSGEVCTSNPSPLIPKTQVPLSVCFC